MYASNSESSKNQYVLLLNLYVKNRRLDFGMEKAKNKKLIDFSYFRNELWNWKEQTEVTLNAINSTTHFQVLYTLKKRKTFAFFNLKRFFIEHDKTEI